MKNTQRREGRDRYLKCHLNNNNLWATGIRERCWRVRFKSRLTSMNFISFKRTLGMKERMLKLKRRRRKKIGLTNLILTIMTKLTSVKTFSRSISNTLSLHSALKIWRAQLTKQTLFSSTCMLLQTKLHLTWRKYLTQSGQKLTTTFLSNSQANSKAFSNFSKLSMMRNLTTSSTSKIRIYS